MKIDIKTKTKNFNKKLKEDFIKKKEDLNIKIKKKLNLNNQSLTNVKKNIKDRFKNFFDWVKGAELIELEKCDTNDDPVRPELNNEFRTSYGRKIYGVKYQNEIHAVMCFAFTNDIPRSVNDLEQLSKDAFLQSVQRDQNVGKIAIAYTVWSKKKGGGKLIVKEVFKKIKNSNHLNRLVTLSPLTEMATKFHKKNGAKLLQVNELTQNFEYQVEKKK